MNENVKKEKNIFSLVISIMTLAVMSLGTSFAFFSSVVRSEEQAKVGSINFKLSAKIEPLYNTKKIIPTNDEDIMKAFNNECIDKYGWGACYAYNIKIVGEGEPQDVYGKFRFDALPRQTVSLIASHFHICFWCSL